MNKFVVIFIIVALFQTSCTKAVYFESGRWVGQGPIPGPSSDLHLAEKPLSVGTRNLILQTQKIDGAEIEGSYYKKITQNGQDEFITYHWPANLPLSLHKDIFLMKAQKPFVVGRFLKLRPSYAATDLFSGPSLVVNLEEEPQVLWRLIFEDSDGSLQAFFMNANYELVRQAKAGSEFIEATAQLFPEGPLKSSLQQVFLRGLLNNKELSSPLVRITTEANLLAAASDQNEFNFATNDVRFSQVQAFFYVSEALAWFEKNFQFKIPFPLEVETQKGFPEKTNTAFYFQHKIRLGDGDGETYDRIPTDPSIVTHETLHAVIEAVAGLPYEGAGGSLNEAFADFLTAVQLNNPKLGEASYKKGPFKRTIENDLKFQDLKGGLYQDSTVVSGLLWAIYKANGSQSGLNVAWLTLLRLTPSSDFAAFKQELLSVLEKESPQAQKRALAELERRGWLQ